MSNSNSFRTIHLVLVAMFAALMAIGANVTSFLVIGSVPVTMQAFFSILAGALLGRRLGALSMTIYLFIGLVGFPVFAQFKGGLGQLIHPTFGFLLSFILAAYMTGLIIEKSKKKSLRTFVIASFSSLIITYIAGTHYMYYAFQFLTNLDAVGYKVVWGWMLAPFIKDFILTIFATILAKRIYAVVQQRPTNTTKVA